MPVYNSAENEFHGSVVKLVDGDGVEVAEESRGDRIASTPWRTHRSYQQNVHQVDLQPRRLKDNYALCSAGCITVQSVAIQSMHAYKVLA